MKLNYNHQSEIFVFHKNLKQQMQLDFDASAQKQKYISSEYLR